MMWNVNFLGFDMCGNWCGRFFCMGFVSRWWILKRNELVLLYVYCFLRLGRRMIYLYFVDIEKEFVGIKDVLNRCDSCFFF